MAILEAVPGIRVSVVSNGEILEEYPDEDEFKHKRFSAPVDRISTTYIECLSEAEFHLEYEITPQFVPALYHTNMCFWVEIDGKGLGGYWPEVGIDTQWNRTFHEAILRVSENEISRQKLRFSTIQKLDDVDSERVKQDAKLVDGLGEIIVHVHRAIVSNTQNEVYAPSEVTAPVTEVAEKALKGKAISHGVVFGQEQRIRQATNPKTTYPDGYSYPLAIFRFKYRSREALQAEMIIPRSPSPDPVLAPRNRNVGNRRESNQERLARLRREIEALEEAEGIKPEIKKENGLPPLRKRVSDASDVQSGRAYKTSRRSNGAVVVDLTDD